jgi:hypothetical protein
MTRWGTGLLLAGLAGLAIAGPGTEPARAQQRGDAAGREAPVETTVVVDSAGRVVGPVISMFYFLPFVRLRAGGSDVLMLVRADRLVTLGVEALYETTDCTGTPWVPAFTSSSAPVGIVELGVIGRLGELLVSGGDPVTRTISSSWNTLDTPPACQPVAPPQNGIVQPTRVLIDVSHAFTPPFRFR